MSTHGEDEDICGETFDHDEEDLGDGHWRCRRCDAEGWDEEEVETPANESTGGAR